MQQKKQPRQGGLGRLPAAAPLANPYVPFQMEDPPKYEPRKAFVRGTLFPGLDLPFMGMVNKTEKPVTPLGELQTMAFVLQELVLYLDTHREDKEALALYRTFQKMYNKGRTQYEQQYLETLFAGGKGFKSEPDTLNRNYIGHGMNRRAVRKRDCIQLFLALNNLMHFFDLKL